MPVETEEIIKKLQEACMLAGVKLTSKRKNVLIVLLSSKTPLSAYEIADSYKEQFQESLPVMSVYRMLDFLIKERLAHKLETSGQYISCAHIACDHQHEAPQFLICDRCGSVKEVGMKKPIVDEIERSVLDTGFTLAHRQLELHGICKRCLNRSAQK
ncbi:MAG: Fur family transcriptional regulator [Nitrosomonas sp.]|nr:transcriptional repressor [Nitrosomonas sp.]